MKILAQLKATGLALSLTTFSSEKAVGTVP